LVNRNDIALDYAWAMRFRTRGVTGGKWLGRRFDSAARTITSSNHGDEGGERFMQSRKAIKAATRTLCPSPSGKGGGEG
jgi:hypothetical protein